MNVDTQREKQYNTDDVLCEYIIITRIPYSTCVKYLKKLKLDNNKNV